MYENFNEIDAILEIEEAEIINIINPEYRQYIVRERPDHLNIWNDSEFFNRFRLSKETVLAILELIEEEIRHKTNRNSAVSPLLQLLITLRFYASGSIYIVVGDFAGVHKSTAGKIVKRVTAALTTLAPIWIQLPLTEEMLLTTKQQFYEIARFPRVIGAIDCTHIKLQSPGGPNAEYFRNRKGFFSLNVQCLCNANYEITDIVARWPGSSHDSHIFDNSRLRMRFETRELGDAIVLGDGGYPLRPYLLTPFQEPQNAVQHLYNESQIRTRNVIERTFGIWKRRFPILSLGIRCNLELAQDIIVATCTLHNFARNRNEEDFQHVDINDLANEDENNQVNNGNRRNDRVRNEILEYFRTLL